MKSFQTRCRSAQVYGLFLELERRVNAGRYLTESFLVRRLSLGLLSSEEHVAMYGSVYSHIAEFIRGQFHRRGRRTSANIWTGTLCGLLQEAMHTPP